MLNKVVVIAVPKMAPFEFGVACEVFGLDRSDSGGPRFDFHLATPEPGAVRTNLGFDVMIMNDLRETHDADLIVVTSHAIGQRVHPAIAEALRAAVARGAWVLGVCSGAFALADAGVLTGRKATTHWIYADALAQQHPDVSVDPDVLFVEDGTVITSAGTSAGIDACLHLVRRELGASAANIIARRMVVPPQRSGGQSQYIQAPISLDCSDSFAEVTEWMLANLDQDLSVDQLAKRALMSSRTFARRFRADLGTTPAAWINRQRLIRAQQMLEESNLPLETVARDTGFGSASVMRHHFAKTLHTTPAAYRQTFTLRPQST